jgi:hypothetical protein
VADVLDREVTPELPIREDVASAIAMTKAKEVALSRGRAIIDMLSNDLTPGVAPWFSGEWTESTIGASNLRFNEAFERWRSLFRATRAQMEQAHKIQMNAAAGEKERREATERYNEARSQQELLLEGRRTSNSDFYTYPKSTSPT